MTDRAQRSYAQSSEDRDDDQKRLPPYMVAEVLTRPISPQQEVAHKRPLQSAFPKGKALGYDRDSAASSSEISRAPKAARVYDEDEDSSLEPIGRSRPLPMGRSEAISEASELDLDYVPMGTVQNKTVAMLPLPASALAEISATSSAQEPKFSVPGLRPVAASRKMVDYYPENHDASIGEARSSKGYHPEKFENEPRTPTRRFVENGASISVPPGGSPPVGPELSAQLFGSPDLRPVMTANLPMMM